MRIVTQTFSPCFIFVATFTKNEAQKRKESKKAQKEIVA